MNSYRVKIYRLSCVFYKSNFKKYIFNLIFFILNLLVNFLSFRISGEFMFMGFLINLFFRLSFCLKLVVVGFFVRRGWCMGGKLCFKVWLGNL